MSNEGTTNVSKTECTEKIHAVFAQLLAAGHTEEVIVAVVIEECRRVRNEAFCETY